MTPTSLVAGRHGPGFSPADGELDVRVNRVHAAYVGVCAGPDRGTDSTRRAHRDDDWTGRRTGRERQATWHGGAPARGSPPARLVGGATVLGVAGVAAGRGTSLHAVRADRRAVAGLRGRPRRAHHPCAAPGGGASWPQVWASPCRCARRSPPATAPSSSTRPRRAGCSGTCTAGAARPPAGRHRQGRPVRGLGAQRRTGGAGRDGPGCAVACFPSPVRPHMAWVWGAASSASWVSWSLRVPVRRRACPGLASPAATSRPSGSRPASIVRAMVVELRSGGPRPAHLAPGRPAHRRWPSPATSSPSSWRRGPRGQRRRSGGSYRSRSSCWSAWASPRTSPGGARARAWRRGCSVRPGSAPTPASSTAVVYGVLVLVASLPGPAWSSRRTCGAAGLPPVALPGCRTDRRVPSWRLGSGAAGRRGGGACLTGPTPCSAAACRWTAISTAPRAAAAAVQRRRLRPRRRERASCDAILVGAATIRNDNPRLLVRSPSATGRTRRARSAPPSPAKVTVTTTANSTRGAAFFAAGRRREKLVYCRSDSIDAAPATARRSGDRRRRRGSGRPCGGCPRTCTRAVSAD